MLLKKQWLLLNISYEYFCGNQDKKNQDSLTNWKFEQKFGALTDIWQTETCGIDQQQVIWMVIRDKFTTSFVMKKYVSLQQGDMFLDKMKRSSKIHLYLKRALLHTVRVGVNNVTMICDIMELCNISVDDVPKHCLVQESTNCCLILNQFLLLPQKIQY